MNIQSKTLEMTFGILANHGPAFSTDKELQKIWKDGTDGARVLDETKMRSALERFAEWDKRQAEAGR